ncbi:hypothetical protein [Paludisphaera soli]|uniref:hypothetical protein n=1 Tax=Paludisphaera soli TaxID=2712865 RepID=UPI0013EA17DF|nr:hypothetical protein [Paludisphaera soli]
MAKRRRRDLGLERLECRTTPSMTAALDAAGVLTLGWRGEGGGNTVDICIVDGESVVSIGYGYGAIDVAADPGGLIASSDYGTKLRIQGVTRLEIEAGDSRFVRITQLDVPAAVRFSGDNPTVILGDQYGSTGLAAISAPVDVRSVRAVDEHFSSAELWLMDGRSTASLGLVVESNSITATAPGGFGGVTYSGLDAVRFEETPGEYPDKLLTFQVRSTHAGLTSLSMGGAGRSSVVIDATAAPDDRPPPAEDWVADGRTTRSLLVGGAADVEIRRTPSRITLHQPGRVEIGDEGSTAGIAHDVWIGRPPYFSFGRTTTRIIVDDSAGTVAHDARLGSRRNSPYTADRDATLSGVAGGLITVERFTWPSSDSFVGEFEYRAPRGLANKLTIEMEGGPPLPASPGRFVYDGGSEADAPSAGGGPTLTLVGTLWSNASVGQEHHAETASSGDFSFQVWYISHQIPPALLGYRGMAGGRVDDQVAAESYILYVESPDALMTIQKGQADPDGSRPLLIETQGFVTNAVTAKDRVAVYQTGNPDPVNRWRGRYDSDAPTGDDAGIGLSPGVEVEQPPPGEGTPIGEGDAPLLPPDPNVEPIAAPAPATPAPAEAGPPGAAGDPVLSPSAPETSPVGRAEWATTMRRPAGPGGAVRPMSRLQAERLARLAARRAARAELLLGRRASPRERPSGVGSPRI